MSVTGVRISQLPAAGPLTGDELLVGVQDGETRKVLVSQILQRAPYLQPLSGTVATIPLPQGVLAATVTVVNAEGAEVGVLVRHQMGQVVIESNVDMVGLTARLSF